MQRKRGAAVHTFVMSAIILWLGYGVSAAQGGGTPTGGAVMQSDPWPSLSIQIFHDHHLQDGTTVLAIDAPYRAEDAALVPVTIRSVLPPGDARQIRRITLVIDENPSPLAAVFEFGPGSGIDRISTRVRIDDYTYVHAVAEMSDGTLYAVQRFVKAAGGCSAPAVKQVAGDVPVGTMRFRRFPGRSGTIQSGTIQSGTIQSGTIQSTTTADKSEAELMIRHPNYSGMQMDQLTRLYVPAHFVRSISIWQGDQKLLSIQGGISLSENPAFRFDYRPDGAKSFHAEAIDSKDQKFSGQWPAGATSVPAG